MAEADPEGATPAGEGGASPKTEGAETLPPPAPAAEGREAGAAAAEGKPAKPSPLFLYLVVVPVGLLLLYGLIAAAISGRYPKLAVPLRERIHRDLESEDASAAAVELAALSVGQPFEGVRRAFALPESAWGRLPAEEGSRFESPPLEAEVWRATVNGRTRPIFLVVHGTVIEWREE